MKNKRYKNIQAIEERQAIFLARKKRMITKLKIRLWRWRWYTFEYYAPYIGWILISILGGSLVLILFLKYCCWISGGSVNDFLPL